MAIGIIGDILDGLAKIQKRNIHILRETQRELIPELKVRTIETKDG